MFTILFLGACTTNRGADPVIVVDSICVNNVRWNPVAQESISPQSVIDIHATLLALEDAELYTVNVISKAEYGEVTMTENSNRYYNTAITDSVATDVVRNYGDSILVFRDKVNQSKIVVTTSLSDAIQKELELSVSLNLNTKDAGTIVKNEFVIAPSRPHPHQVGR